MTFHIPFVPRENAARREIDSGSGRIIRDWDRIGAAMVTRGSGWLKRDVCAEKTLLRLAVVVFPEHA